MISVVYVTNRGLYPMLRPPWSELTQYDLLGDSLRKQEHADFEVVVVDEHNPIPRRELTFLGDRVRFVRPRATPWRALGAFAPSSARNTGLAHARGELVLGLDDCVSFGSDLLARAWRSWQRGTCLVPTPVGESGRPVCVPHGNLRGGILCYPRELAVRLGGHEERFDGCHSLEDWEFSGRLHAHGVVWDDDPRAVVMLHSHTPHEGRPAAVAPHGYHRCAYAVHRLTAGQAQANRPWTPSQLDVFTAGVCPYGPTHCAAQAHLYPDSPRPCACPARPAETALTIMRTHEASPWLGGLDG